MPAVPQPLRFALRSLRARWSLSLVAVTVLALGIGAATTVFSVVNAILLEPLPYPASGRLVEIRGVSSDDPAPDNLSPADFLDFARETRSFEAIGAHGWVGWATLNAGDRAERIGKVDVTWGFFTALGVQPRIGRGFTPDEDLPGQPPVALITDGLWRRRFGGDPSVLGRRIEIDAVPTTIVGVLPPDYWHYERYPDRTAEIFTLYRFPPTGGNRGGHFIRGVGRLAEGTTEEQAGAELDAIAARLEREYPRSNTDQGVMLQPLAEAVVGDTRAPLWILLGAVGLLLLIACANVANLLLADGARRERELAIQRALGASRQRIGAQLLFESLLLGLGGAIVGAFLSWIAIRAAATVGATIVPRWEHIAVDAMVLLFAASLAILTSLAFGLVPAWHSAHADVTPALGGQRGVGDAPRRRTRDVLVATEVALSLILLVGATLLLRSQWLLERVDPGFVPGERLTMQVSLATARYEEGEQIPFYEELVERIGALPGVTAVGGINILPLTENYDSSGFQIDERPLPVGQGPSEQVRSVMPGYFGAMGIPLIRGRLFDRRDFEGAPRVVVISEAMAGKFWPGQDVIGKRLTYNRGLPEDDQQDVGGPGSREVIGVVGDVKHLSLTDAGVPMIYTPHAQQPSYHTMTLVVRATADPAALTGAIREQVTAMDVEVPLYAVHSLDDVLDTVAAAPRFRTVLLSAFSTLALLLSAAGVYAVVSLLVGQRTREIGVRLALGARKQQVVQLMARQGLVPVAAGLVAGALGAVALTRLLSDLLYGVTPGDPLTYGAAVLVLGASALAASVMPARRAAQVDPVEVLRAE